MLRSWFILEVTHFKGSFHWTTWTDLNFFSHFFFCFSTSIDLWLHYIQEEMGPRGRPENCGKIHWRAMKFLEGESVEKFTTKYTLLQTGHLWAATLRSASYLGAGVPPPPAADWSSFHPPIVFYRKPHHRFRSCGPSGQFTADFLFKHWTENVLQFEDSRFEL